MNEPTSFPITYQGSVNIPIAKNSVVYTDSFRFGDVDTFAVSYIISVATGIPNLRIQIEQSMVDATNKNAADANFATPKTLPDIETTLTSKLIQHADFTPLCLLYVRFKITEQTNSVTDTQLKMWLNLQKKFAMIG